MAPNSVHPVVWIAIGVAAFAAVFLFAALFGFFDRSTNKQTLATTAAPSPGTEPSQETADTEATVSPDAKPVPVKQVTENSPDSTWVDKLWGESPDTTSITPNSIASPKLAVLSAPGTTTSSEPSPAKTAPQRATQNDWYALVSRPSPRLAGRDGATSDAAEWKSQLDLLTQRIAALETENRNLKTQLQQIQQRTIQPKQSPFEPAAVGVQRAPRQVGIVPLQLATPPVPYSGGVYAGVGGGHWIQEKTDDGSILILEDGSIWKVSHLDRIDTNLWLRTTDITVLENDEGFLPYVLINTDDGEKAEAEYMGQE